MWWTLYHGVSVPEIRLPLLQNLLRKVKHPHFCTQRRAFNTAAYLKANLGDGVSLECRGRVAAPSRHADNKTGCVNCCFGPAWTVWWGVSDPPLASFRDVKRCTSSVCGELWLVLLHWKSQTNFLQWIKEAARNVNRSVLYLSGVVIPQRVFLPQPSAAWRFNGEFKQCECSILCHVLHLLHVT